MDAILKNKKIMAVTFMITGVLIAGIIIFLFKPTGKGSINIEEQLSLGEKYLLELDYDNAIIAFNKIIEIEPMNVKAYIGLSDAYIGKGNIKEAADSLEIIYEKTKDKQVIDFISDLGEEIKKGILLSKSIIPVSEIMVAGIPILETSYDNVVNALSQRYADSLITDWNTANFVYGENGSFIYVSENADNNNIHMHYENSKNNMTPERIVTDIRNISIGDSFESVLNKLGFSKIGIYYISSKNTGIELNIDEHGDLSNDYHIESAENTEVIKYIQLFPSNEQRYAQVMMEFSSDNILENISYWVNYFEHSSAQTQNTDITYNAENFLGHKIQEVIDLFGDDYVTSNDGGSSFFYYEDFKIPMIFFIGKYIDDNKITGQDTIKYIAVIDGEIIPGIKIGDTAEHIAEVLNVEYSEPEYSDYEGAYQSAYDVIINGVESTMFFLYEQPDGGCVSAQIKGNSLY